jgi:hypothetical protein
MPSIFKLYGSIPLDTEPETEANRPNINPSLRSCNEGYDLPDRLIENNQDFSGAAEDL